MAIKDIVFKKTSFLFFLTGLIACSSKVKDEFHETNSFVDHKEASLEIPFQPLKITYNEPDTILSVRFDSVFILQPEITENHVFRSIEKVVKAGDNFIIKGPSDQPLVAVNQSGRVSTVFGAIGEGPHEYIEISDFDVSEELGEVVILEKHANKILHFSLEGDFKKAYLVSNRQYSRFKSIAFLGQDTLVIAKDENSPDQDSNYSLFYIVNEEIVSVRFPLPETTTSKMVLPYHFHRSSTNAVDFILPQNDTLFRISGDRIDPKLVLRYEEEEFSLNEEQKRSEVPDVSFNAFLQVWAFDSVHFVRNSFIKYLAIKDGSSYLFRARIDDSLPVGEIVGSDENYLIIGYNGEQLYEDMVSYYDKTWKEYLKDDVRYHQAMNNMKEEFPLWWSIRSRVIDNDNPVLLVLDKNHISWSKESVHEVSFVSPVSLAFKKVVEQEM